MWFEKTPRIIVTSLQESLQVCNITNVVPLIDDSINGPIIPGETMP